MEFLYESLNCRFLPGKVFEKSLGKVYFNNLYFLFHYDQIYNLIKLYKFEGRLDLAGYFVRFLEKTIDKSIWQGTSLFTFIPNHEKPNNFLLSVMLSERIGIKFMDLFKVNPSNSQAQHLIKDKNQRIKNAKNKFVLKTEYDFSGLRKLVIFDDISTTGASLNEVCKIVKSLNQGIDIDCLVIAKA
ncbi:MAG: hypothetical protein N2657_02605 [bacterium]|nr:hypothetical protein [bacterium]